jgi:hypothetical protein
MSEIKINIGTLVLDGFDFHDHVRITSEFNQELHRLLARNGLKIDNLQSNNIKNIDMKNLRMSSDITSKSIGSKLANSVYQNLSTQVTSNQKLH